MNKNLEEFKKNKDILTDWEAIHLAFKVLEDFEKRLKIVEAELGIYTIKKERRLK